MSEVFDVYAHVSQEARDNELMRVCVTLAMGDRILAKNERRKHREWMRADHHRLMAIEAELPSVIVESRAREAQAKHEAYEEYAAYVQERRSSAATYIREHAAKSAPPEPEEDEDNGCEGHESLDGAHMGETVYCDGSCQRSEESRPTGNRWVSIVFMQGDEGHEVVRKLMRAEGVVYSGATDETIAEVVEELKAWDYGDESEVNITDEPQWGIRDELARVGDYVLAWNSGLGYVSLNRRVR